MSTSVKEQINAEFDAYYEDRTRDLNPMFNMLYQYIRPIVAMTIKKGDYIDDEAVHELTQDIMLVISTEKVNTFERRQAKFTTYCAEIAKNKALDYGKKRDRHELADYDKVQNEKLAQEENGKDSLLSMEGRSIYKNPELLLIQQEKRLEQICLLRKYLQLLMDYNKMPYRVVSCCFSMILFHKYHPDVKVLGSPKWAYEELKVHTVEEGADRYHKEINEWFPSFHLFWGGRFQDRMDEQEQGVFISDMVYDKHFETSDFENWYLRARKHMRERLLEQEQEVLE